MITQDELLTNLKGPCTGDVTCSRERIKDAILRGDYPDAVRLLRNGYFPCAAILMKCQYDRETLLANLIAEIRADLQIKWKFAGMETGLSVNFVCTNPVKLRALRAAMEVGDIVPMAFNMKDVSALTGGQMVVQVEI